MTDRPPDKDFPTAENTPASEKPAAPGLPGTLLVIEFVLLGAAAAYALKRYAGLSWSVSLLAGVIVIAGLTVLLYRSRLFFWSFLVIVALLVAAALFDFIALHFGFEPAIIVAAVGAGVSIWLNIGARAEISQPDALSRRLERLRGSRSGDPPDPDIS